MKHSLVCSVIGLAALGGRADSLDEHSLALDAQQLRPVNTSPSANELKAHIVREHRLAKRVDEEHSETDSQDLYQYLFDNDPLDVKNDPLDVKNDPLDVDDQRQKSSIDGISGELPSMPTVGPPPTPTRDEGRTTSRSLTMQEREQHRRRLALSAVEVHMVWLDRSRSTFPQKRYPSKDDVHNLLDRLQRKFFHLFREERPVLTTAFELQFGQGFICRIVWINPQSLHLSADVPSIARREVYPEACRVFRDNRSGALLDDSEAPPLRTHIETRLLAGTRSVKGSPSGMGMMVRSVSGNFAFGYRVWPTERYQPTDRQTRLLVWPEEDKIMEEFIEMMFSKLPRLEIGGRPLEPPVEEGRETKHTRRPLKRPRPTDISPNKATKR